MSKKWKIPDPEISNITGKIYTLNGKSYCRVTNTLSVIAKNGLFGWYMKVGKQKAQAIIKNRQVLGTKVHSIFEHILKGDYEEEEISNEEIKECIRGFKIFKYNTSLEPEGLEQRLWNDKYGYAGTADFIGKYTTWKPYCVRGHDRGFENDLVIGDWKTSRNIYDDYWLQMAAYAYAFYKLTGIKPKGAFIAQFRNGQIKVKERTWDELMKEFEVYKSVLTVYKWKYKIE
jgi:hypothetical protein